MRKSTITRVWLGGMIAIAIGFVVVGIGVVLMLSNGTFTAAPRWEGYDFTPTQNGSFWTAVALMTVGGLIGIGGLIAQFVAWIGALVNSSRLADKSWFVITLVLGLVGFGLIVMILYLLMAPDAYEDGFAGTPTGVSAPPSLAATH